MKSVRKSSVKVKVLPILWVCFSYRISGNNTLGWLLLGLVSPFGFGIKSSEGVRRERRTVLFSGWQPHNQPDQYHYPRTENYYHKMKPGSGQDAVVEIMMDPRDEDDGYGHRIVEHSSKTTSIQSESEYSTSCVKEPGCRWECEPRQDELPPDCDCVCFYTDAKWDNMP